MKNKAIILFITLVNFAVFAQKNKIIQVEMQKQYWQFDSAKVEFVNHKKELYMNISRTA